MTYEIRNNEEQGINRLPIQFNDSQKLQALLATYLKEIDVLQDLSQDYLEGMRLDNAIGNQLDAAGLVVNERRQARNDKNYREAIRSKIVLNTSKGRPQDLYSAARTITSAQRVGFWEHFPASVVVAVSNEGLASFSNSYPDDIDNSLVAGVKLGELLVDTTNQGFLFSEIVFEQGTVEVSDGNDLINDNGDFIGYQLVPPGNPLTTQSIFAEVRSDDLVVDQTWEDQLEVNGSVLQVNDEPYDISFSNFSLNGDTWVVIQQTAGQGGGNPFYEAVR